MPTSIPQDQYEFKIGARVIYQPKGWEPKIGTILGRDTDGDFEVVFDAKVPGGHDLDGKVRDGYGFWVSEYEVEEGYFRLASEPEFD